MIQTSDPPQPQNQSESTTTESSSAAIGIGIDIGPGLRRRRNDAHHGPSSSSSSSSGAEKSFTDVHALSHAHVNNRVGIGAASAQLLPPRASYSLGTTDLAAVAARSHTTTKTDARFPTAEASFGNNENDNASVAVTAKEGGGGGGDSSGLICVFGFGDAASEEKVFNRFASYGTIIQRFPVGVNAFAIRYSNPLHTSKALCQKNFVVDGYYCGVFRLSDHPDMMMMMAENHENDPSLFAIVPRPSTTNTAVAPSLFAPTTVTGIPAKSSVLHSHSAYASKSCATITSRDNETDTNSIFLHKNHRVNTAVESTSESIIIRLLRWCLAIE